MLAGMSHRRKAGIAETRFRGMNATAEARKRSCGTESGLQRLEDFFYSSLSPRLSRDMTEEAAEKAE